jgi:hypothetical protein
MGEKMFTRKSEVFDRPSVMSDGLVQSADQKIYERQRSTISELSCEFPQISCTVLCEIITIRLGYLKCWTRRAVKAVNAHTFIKQADQI